MTGSDWELLEAAAKAAGIEYGVIHDTPRIKCDAGWTPWNPLADDGDALRLAVRLNLHISVFVDAIGIGTPGAGYDELKYEGDPYAATRRAIVRAAAEIGKNMS